MDSNLDSQLIKGHLRGLPRNRRGIGKLYDMSIALASIVMLGPFLIPMLPLLLCERLRAFTWLPLAGFTFSVALTWTAYGLFSWKVAIWVGMVALVFGNWMPPRPFRFVSSRRFRRGVGCAIQFLENAGSDPIYHDIRVLDDCDEHCDLEIKLGRLTFPTQREFVRVHYEPLSVGYTPTEELDGLGVRPQM